MLWPSWGSASNTIGFCTRACAIRSLQLRLQCPCLSKSSQVRAARRPRTHPPAAAVPPHGERKEPNTPGRPQPNTGRETAQIRAARHSEKGPERSRKSILTYACCAGLAPTKSRVAGPAPFYAGPPKYGGRAGPRPPGPVVFSGSLWPSGAPGNNRAAKSERVIFVE